MTNGWSGADPAAQDDGGNTQYTLATRYTANADVSISAIRVWHGPTAIAVTNRNGQLWQTNGTLLATVAMASSLPNGWTEYTLDTVVDITNGTSFDVSYDTTRYYGFTAGGYPRNSSDNSLTATQGRFAEAHDTFPTSTSTGFYGIDVVYTVTGANQPPVITGVTVTQSETTVLVNATITDETPAAVALTWDWGDGTSVTSTSAGVTTADHTYSNSGLYAILVTATDNGDLTDTYAVPVSITSAGAITGNEEWFDDILDAIVSDVQRTGYFDRVNTHEPKSAPGSGLTAAVWIESMDPIAAISGLASTSGRLVFKLRAYQSMLSEPQDMIDPRMGKAVSNLMRRYHDDFDFEGAIRNIDLLGAYGVSLSAVSGYLDIAGKQHRVMDLTIPCLVNDIWPQVN